MNTSTRDFSLGIGSLGLLRIALPFIPVPKSVAPAVDFAILIVVFVVTIWSIYRMMSTDLNLKQVLLLTLCGVAVHVCGVALNVLVFHGQGVGSIIALAIAQTGLPIWCIGLGAMIASLLREKNILIPVAIFLVSWDIFLVLSPTGFTQKMMKSAPAVLQQGGLSLPKSQAGGATVSTVTNAVAGYVGPADLVFLGAFFLAMFRFKMKPDKTFRVLVPVLIAYMVIVLATGISLPALVPIGIVVLAVNWSEFKLTKDEWAGTAVVGLIAAAILFYAAITQKKPKKPTEPLPSATSQESAKSPESLETTNPSPPPSEPQNVLKSKPSPQ
jgi:hypothetical protein